VFSLLVAQPAAAQTWPPGELLTDAAALHLTDELLRDLTTVVDGAIPDQVEVPTVNESGHAGICSCDFTITDMVAHLEAENLSIVPDFGKLELLLDLSVAFNEGASPFTLAGSCGIGLDCDASYVRPFPVEVRVPFTFEVLEVEPGVKPSQRP
jgi:hypothetical protein